MNTSFIIEGIGYLGSALVLVGYLTPQNSERRMAPVFLRQIEISYYS